MDGKGRRGYVVGCGGEGRRLGVEFVDGTSGGGAK